MPQLSLLVIKTNRLQELAVFYSVLGFEFEYHKHGNGPYHYASKDTMPIIEIYPLPKATEQPDSTTRLGFIVNDLNTVVEKCSIARIKIVSAPMNTEWGYSAVIQDPDGRKVELTER